MAASTQLFDLIYSLSTSEKRYFRLYCNLQAGEKNYLRLFDFLAAQEHYDEERVKKEFAGETFVKSLHVTKNYLYSLILRSLRSFHQDDTVEMELYNLLIEANLLERRGLYNQVLSHLSKIRKLASKYHYTLIQAEAIIRALRLTIAQETNNLEAEILNLANELELTIGNAFDEHRLNAEMYKWGLLVRKKQLELVSLPQLHVKWNQLKDDLIISDEKAVYRAILYYRIINIEKTLLNDSAGAVEAAKKIIELWNNHPHLKTEKPEVYKIYLNNYLTALFKVGRLDEFPAILHELKALPSNNFNEEAETFSIVAFNELLYFLNTRNFQTALQSLDYISNGLERYKAKIHKAREFSFYYNISVLYFMMERHEEALDWLQKILNHPKTEHRKDLQRFANLLQLIYHFELGNYYLLDSMIQTIQKKMNRWTPLSTFEDLFFKQMFLLNKSSLNDKSRRPFPEFLDSMIRLRESEETHLGLEEVIIWLTRQVK